MKSSKFKVQSSKFNSGFTLVELLVVVSIIVSVTTIVVGTITSVFRGTNKTNTINTVRENGNYAISQMTKMIKFAKSFDGASIDGNPPWNCQIMPPLPTPAPALVNYKSLRITSFDGGVTTFSCNDSVDIPAQTIASRSASSNETLIDTTTVALPTPIPTFCFFTCIKERITDSPQVGINFTLNSNSISGIVERQASIPFSISIKVRN
jgi:prepilin-type N-terminal cleavage/methylation domain-containing protein